jgi:hypothetical protein
MPLLTTIFGRISGFFLALSFFVFVIFILSWNSPRDHVWAGRLALELFGAGLGILLLGLLTAKLAKMIFAGHLFSAD